MTSPRRGGGGWVLWVGVLLAALFAIVGGVVDRDAAGRHLSTPARVADHLPWRHARDRRDLYVLAALSAVPVVALLLGGALEAAVVAAMFPLLLAATALTYPRAR